VADLIAIGYPDMATADEAADEARRLAQDLIIQPDAIAVIVRDTDGSYHVHTTHHMVSGGAVWGFSGCSPGLAGGGFRVGVSRSITPATACPVPSPISEPTTVSPG
jgi:uncharacterized membrane protein